ncbi:hypothetical protein LCM4577_31540 [Mesorhizobium sp. LCM 4577]|uniref:hypothetical protein n=1 Tax=unclassified Mesorhizobium TaxID=325217 RepID=UPI0008DAFCC3|nr:hypothetical protein [Mesorhizobium sp. LCM 4576]OHV64507.1 hypothetical protein LCM4577_31540 [Mesorhizobium sp. LCM 4577]OHV66988.1 hypothetical protein LCM4576_25590 [Mesorhizobium sp. LCM 4576]
MAAVIASLAGAFAAVSLFSFVVATQVSDLAQNTPVYQINILTKVRALKYRTTHAITQGGKSLPGRVHPLHKG